MREGAARTGAVGLSSVTATEIAAEDAKEDMRDKNAMQREAGTKAPSMISDLKKCAFRQQRA